jgi:GTP cyclohydrolase IB
VVRRQSRLGGLLPIELMTNLTDALHIPDTQSGRDERRLAIQRVGVKDVRYPLTLQVAGAAQSTAASWDLDVALPAEAKGTHMSRFVAWLDALEAPLDAATLRAQLGRMLELLNAQEGRIEARFSFFLRKRAPVSGVQSLLDYQGRWIAETRDGRTSLWSEVGVPVKSLCPCSKEISDYGAHNQRSLVTIRLEQLQPIEWHEQVRFAEDAASSEIWPLLKRADEKWITERAYENPKFVEDIVRDVALKLNADVRVGRYSVDVENIESIHNHSAYARIERA